MYCVHIYICTQYLTNMVYFYLLLTENFVGCKIIFVFKFCAYVVYFLFMFTSYMY